MEVWQWIALYFGATSIAGVMLCGYGIGAGRVTEEDSMDRALIMLLASWFILPLCVLLAIGEAAAKIQRRDNP